MNLWISADSLTRPVALTLPRVDADCRSHGSQIRRYISTLNFRKQNINFSRYIGKSGWAVHSCGAHFLEQRVNPAVEFCLIRQSFITRVLQRSVAGRLFAAGTPRQVEQGIEMLDAATRLAFGSVVYRVRIFYAVRSL